MASTDDTVESSISSVLVDSLRSNKNGDPFSPEEIDWVDSCLVNDSEISDGDWTSMKDALIEILGLQPEPNHFSAPGTDGFLGGTNSFMGGTDSIPGRTDSVPGRTDSVPGGTDIEMLHSADLGTIKSTERTDDNSTQVNKEMEASSDNEENDTLLSTTSLRNAFLPNYREENYIVIESDDSGLDIGSSTYETELTTNDIFKVWELGIPSEENDLFKQLNKVLTESNVQPIPSARDDPEAWKDLKAESVDDLIAEITDLSLNQHK